MLAAPLTRRLLRSRIKAYVPRLISVVIRVRIVSTGTSPTLIRHALATLAAVAGPIAVAAVGAAGHLVPVPTEAVAVQV